MFRRRTKKRISRRRLKKKRKSLKLKYRIYSTKGFVSHI